MRFYKECLMLAGLILPMTMTSLSFAEDTGASTEMSAPVEDSSVTNEASSEAPMTDTQQTDTQQQPRMIMKEKMKARAQEAAAAMAACDQTPNPAQCKKELAVQKAAEKADKVGGAMSQMCEMNPAARACQAHGKAQQARQMGQRLKALKDMGATQQ